MANDQVLREQLLRALDGPSHMPLDEAIGGITLEFMNARPPNVPYTPWHLMQHIRITQKDILDFVLDPDYKEPKWPDDYWPRPDAIADQHAWDETIAAIRTDLAAFKALVSDPARDALAVIPHCEVSLAQEVLLVGDHNSYHIGELAILREVMHAWPPGRKG